MDCGKFAFFILCCLLRPYVASSQDTCPDAPVTPGDRRSDKSVVKIASYNMYWLFDGKSDPNPVPWTSWQSAYSHAKHMAGELERINADIYVLVEVEDCSILDYVIKQMSDPTLYKRYIVKGTDSATGQDVALLTKIDPTTPLTRSSEYVDYPLSGSKCTDKTTGSTGVSKHFATTIRISETPDITIGVMGIHLLAQPTNAERCAPREAQGKVVADYAKLMFDASVANGSLAGYVVMGDYNEFSNEVLDVHDSVPMSMAMDNIRDAGVSSTGSRLFEVSSLITKTDLYTYGTGSSAELIDHIIMSEPLKDLIVDGGSYIDHRESATKDNGGSDHWCFVTTLRTAPTTDECALSPCGAGQDCKDLSLSQTGDFICSCKPEFGSISSYGSAAVCELDECTLPGTCDELFSCTDRNTSVASLGDVTCSCRSNDCKARNECDTSPCAVGQSCVDPTLNLTKNDFICTCDPQFGSISSVGQSAICEYDECGPYPCGQGQSCNDANTSIASLNDFVCSGGPPPTSHNDECLSSPCGVGQTCVEVNDTISNDFICRCSTTVGNIAAVGTPAVCSFDECQGTPCASGQTCRDSNTSVASLNDFVCTNTSQIVNECDSTPCDAGQLCVDANWLVAGDFVCSCDASVGNIASVGAAAFCVFDECQSSPCGSQSCSDANTSTASLGDYVCSNSIPMVDECSTSPCGGGQVCFDPDWSVSDNFICKCTASGTVAAVGVAASCTYDECLSGPCYVGQTCSDSNTSISSLGDYVCTNSSSIVDECLSNPCTPGQSCFDPSTTTTGDFVCRCPAAAGNVAAVADAAVCNYDECQSNPCSGSQTCLDPNTSISSFGDYTCTPSQQQGADECLSSPCEAGQTCTDTDLTATGNYICQCPAAFGSQIMSLGQPAVCEYDECSQGPCLQGESCLDKNTSSRSLGDYSCTGGSSVDECAANPCGQQQCRDPDQNNLMNFVCTCPSQFGNIASIAAPAVCSFDECSLTPCPPSELCTDLNTSIASMGDYSCRNASDSFDECVTTPCGDGQVCSDPNLRVINDFKCTCTVTSIGTFAVGESANCSVNECDSNPCGGNQLCTDAKLLSLKDFECSCNDTTYGDKTEIGKPALCSFDECSNSPCGDGQSCSDPSIDKYLDYLCTCDSSLGKITSTGKKALCTVDECASFPCKENEACRDVNISSISTNDFVCVTISSTATTLDECTLNMCPSDQTCVDPDHTTPYNFKCICDQQYGLISAVGKAATCVLDECFPNPCSGESTCKDNNVSALSLKNYVCTNRNQTYPTKSTCNSTSCTGCEISSNYLKSALKIEQPDDQSGILTIPGKVQCPDVEDLLAAAASKSESDGSVEIWVPIVIAACAVLFIAVAVIYYCVALKPKSDVSFNSENMLPEHDWEELSQPPSPSHSNDPSRKIITL
eukprot:TRINITY_DN13513_c0_g3_i1.p1 TRINITY_DN13513_c0_g3~~TRINITY_DN13513_c0_g3_i1.p1  ORF type:complete len:1414 (+),score=278.36 TRINITY_DN13513_c0_g3_i1:37-4278(+)